jgi:GNAT superfamily N-acetyltransferase
MPAPAGVQITEIPLGDARIAEFARYPWKLYKGDPQWAPPLMADLLGNKLLGMQGLLTPEHPYHRTATVTHFMAHRNGNAVGRVSGAINERFDEHYGRKFAFFGFFECEDDREAAHALLDAVKSWAIEQGAEVLRGPGEYSNVTHERQACLIDGFDQPVFVEHTYNPPYYQELLESYGLAKAMDYHAYILDVRDPIPPRLARVAEAVRKRGEITSRPVDMNRFDEDVRHILDIYNVAWSENWGFLPITDWEAEILVETLKPIIDPGLVRFAYVNGELAAVLGCFPDPNVLLQPRWKWCGDSDYVRIARLFAGRKGIERVRLMFFGILPRFRKHGIDALLFEEVQKYAAANGYGACDTSLLLEVNELIIRASEFMGGHRYKTWRIWDLEL